MCACLSWRFRHRGGAWSARQTRFPSVRRRHAAAGNVREHHSRGLLMRALAEPCDAVINPVAPITKTRSCSPTGSQPPNTSVARELGYIPARAGRLGSYAGCRRLGWSNVSGISAQTAAILKREVSATREARLEKWSGLGPESRNEGRARDFSGSGAEIA